MNFKYNNYFFDRFCVLGMFVICFGVFLVLIILINKIELGLGDWKAAVGTGMLLISLIVSMFVAGRLSAMITDNDGEAVFRETYLELILKNQNIQIRYNEVVKIEFEKIVVGGLSFLPIGKMKISLANSRKIKVVSSRREARKLKRENGLVWKYKLNEDGSAAVPDVLLWKVCVELSKRTGQTIYVEKVIEQSSD